MYDRDGLKGNYIMWIRWRPENIGKGERKRIIVALMIVLAFQNSGLNNSSSPQTIILSSFTCVSVFVHTLNPC